MPSYPSWLHAPHMLGDTTGPRPVVSPGSELPILHLGAGYTTATGYSPEAVLGRDVSLGTGLGYQASPGSNESAGPVWQGGGYWESDGTAYLVGDALFDMTGECELVVQWKRSAVDNGHRIAQIRKDASNYWSSSPSSTKFTALLASSGTSRRSETTAALTGAQVSSSQLFLSSGFYRPRHALRGGAVVDSDGGLAQIGAGATIYIGGLNLSSVLPSSAGLQIVAAALYQRVLTDAERDAMSPPGDGAAVSSQVNPLTVAADAWACWDMRNAVDVSGVMKVPDLVLGDFTRGLSQVNGTSARFGVGAFV